MMLICGGGYNGLGCDLMIDPISEEYDSFWIVEFDAYVIMHVHCADLAGLDIDTWYQVGYTGATQRQQEPTMHRLTSGAS